MTRPAGSSSSAPTFPSSQSGSWQPDCPPRETVILVLRSDAPALRISIHKAIVDISQEDVIVAGLYGGCRQPFSRLQQE